MKRISRQLRLFLKVPKENHPLIRFGFGPGKMTMSLGIGDPESGICWITMILIH